MRGRSPAPTSPRFAPLFTVVAGCLALAACKAESATEQRGGANTEETPRPPQPCASERQRHADLDCSNRRSFPCDDLETAIRSCGVEPAKPTALGTLSAESLDPTRLCDLVTGRGVRPLDEPEYDQCVAELELASQGFGPDRFSEFATCRLRELADQPNSISKCESPLRSSEPIDEETRKLAHELMDDACAADSFGCGVLGYCSAEAVTLLDGSARIQCAATRASCEKTPGCTFVGHCSPMTDPGWACFAATDDDCAESRLCKELDHCKALPGEGVDRQFAAHCVSQAELDERADGRPWIELTVERTYQIPQVDKEAATVEFLQTAAALRSCARDSSDAIDEKGHLLTLELTTKKDGRVTKANISGLLTDEHRELRKCLEGAAKKLRFETPLERPSFAVKLSPRRSKLPPIVPFNWKREIYKAPSR